MIFFSNEYRYKIAQWVVSVSFENSFYYKSQHTRFCEQDELFADNCYEQGKIAAENFGDRSEVAQNWISIRFLILSAQNTPLDWGTRLRGSGHTEHTQRDHKMHCQLSRPMNLFGKTSWLFVYHLYISTFRNKLDFHETHTSKKWKK